MNDLEALLELRRLAMACHNKGRMALEYYADGVAVVDESQHRHHALRLDGMARDLAELAEAYFRLAAESGLCDVLDYAAAGIDGPTLFVGDESFATAHAAAAYLADRIGAAWEWFPEECDWKVWPEVVPKLAALRTLPDLYGQIEREHAKAVARLELAASRDTPPASGEPPASLTEPMERCIELLRAADRRMTTAIILSAWEQRYHEEPTESSVKAALAEMTRRRLLINHRIAPDTRGAGYGLPEWEGSKV